MQDYAKQTRSLQASGFTIVELLIVIVVIAILAAIALISFNGVQQRAAEVVLKSDLRNSASKLASDQTIAGSYPESDSDLPRSDGTSYEYDNYDNGSAYCLTGTSSRQGVPAYMVSSDNLTVRQGVCPGHTGPVEGGDTELTAENSTVTTLAGSGVAGYLNATGTAAQFNGPRIGGVDSSGTVYVADSDNYRIRMVSSSGVVTNLAGSIQGYQEGSGSGARFNGPHDVAVDSDGYVYVADRNNHRIRKISPSGVVTTLAGSGIQGDQNGSGGSARFRYPHGVAVDNSGNVYVADRDNHLIRKITPSGVVSTLAGSTEGYQNGSGTSARFSEPRSVAVDSGGNVYVADYGNNRIRKISPGGDVTTLAGSTQGYANGTGEAAQFNMPRGIAVDNSGNVYVADRDNHVIRKITPSGVVTTVAGSTQGYQDGSGSTAQFNGPDGVAVDSSGNVYVADHDNNRIRKISRNN